MKLDAFTQAYIEAALWSSTLPPFGTCPECEGEDKVLCRWDDDQTPVCVDCSERESDYEPPAEDNYGTSDIAAETLARMAEDCRAFQRDNQDLLAQAFDLYSHNPEWSHDEQAGHDFWLTRNGHGAGFWDRGLGDIGRKLADKAHECGSFDLYIGDDGKVYGQ